jgi:uncharacterized membrane protein
MLHLAKRIGGNMLCANLHLLFWLSLMPFTTVWMGENKFTTMPVATYGSVLVMSGLAYGLLQRAIISVHGQQSDLEVAIGKDANGRSSVVLNTLAMAAAFISPIIAGSSYVFVALIWLVPDRRIERIATVEPSPSS